MSAVSSTYSDDFTFDELAIFNCFCKGTVTPQNTVTVKELPRSRSGRKIKPPLAYWSNQRIRDNVAADTVEIIAGSTDYLPQSGVQMKLTGSTELTQVGYIQ